MPHTADTVRTLIDDLAQGHLGRRAFIRRAAALGVSASTIIAALEACGGSNGTSSTPQAASASPATKPAGTPSAAKPAAKGGQAVISLSEPTTLLSGVTRQLIQAWIYSFIANGLTKLHKPDMTVQPDLAESWTTSPDGTSTTFTLHQGVKWQDGQPFSADDVKFTFEYLAHPDWPGPLTSEIAIIQGADAYKKKQATEITGIKVLDATHVQFTLTGSFGLFLATSTARNYLLPRHILKDVAPPDAAKSPFARKPIYTGPFMVQEWKAGEQITFKAFPDCFAGAPQLDTIVARIIPDRATELAELRSGGIEMTFVSPDQYDDFVKDSTTYHTQQLAGATGFYLTFDETLPLFTDPHVRQAMSHAIDRKAVIAALLNGKGDPNFSLASPLTWVYNANLPKFDYDVARAKQLLDAAGWPAGSDGVRVKDGKRFESKITVSSEDTQNYAVAVQPFLKSVGITAQIDRVDPGVANTKVKVSGGYEGTVTSWGNLFVDPRADLSNGFLAPRIVDATGYNNPQVNDLFKKADNSTKQEEQKQLYDQIQQIAEGDGVNVYLWRPYPLLVSRNTLMVPEVKSQGELFAQAAGWARRA
jgi:peptide/nickel transport system substrate-binding protein